MSSGNSFQSSLGSSQRLGFVEKKASFGNFFKKAPEPQKSVQNESSGDDIGLAFTPNPNTRPLLQKIRPRTEHSRVWGRQSGEDTSVTSDDSSELDDEDYIRRRSETSRIWAKLRGEQVDEDNSSDDHIPVKTSFESDEASSTGTIKPEEPEPAEDEDWKIEFEEQLSRYAEDIAGNRVDGAFQAWKKFLRDYSENAYDVSMTPLYFELHKYPGFVYLPAVLPFDEPQRITGSGWHASVIEYSPAEWFDPYVASLQNFFPAANIVISCFNKFYEIVKASTSWNRNTLIPRNLSIGAHLLFSKDFLCLKDVQSDWRFSGNEHVLKENVQFYAGYPMLTSEGHILGVVAIYGTQPGILADHQFNALQFMADKIMTTIEAYQDSTADYDDTARASWLSRASGIGQSSLQISDADDDDEEAELSAPLQNAFNFAQGIYELNADHISEDLQQDAEQASPALRYHRNHPAPLRRVYLNGSSTQSQNTPPSSSGSTRQFQYRGHNRPSRFTMASDHSESLSIDEGEEIVSESSNVRLEQPFSAHRPFSWESHRPFSSSDITSLHIQPPNTPALSAQDDEVDQAAQDVSGISIRGIRSRSGIYGFDYVDEDSQSRTDESFHTASPEGYESSTHATRNSPPASERHPSVKQTEYAELRGPETTSTMHSAYADLANFELLQREKEAGDTELHAPDDALSTHADSLIVFDQEQHEENTRDVRSYVPYSALVAVDGNPASPMTEKAVSVRPRAPNTTAMRTVDSGLSLSQQPKEVNPRLSPRSHRLLYSNPKKYAHLQPPIVKFPYEHGNHVDYTRTTPSEIAKMTYDVINEGMRFTGLDDYMEALRSVQAAVDKHAKMHGWDVLYVAHIQRRKLPPGVEQDDPRFNFNVARNIRAHWGKRNKLDSVDDGLARAFLAAYGMSKKQLEDGTPDPEFHSMVLNTVNHISWEDKNVKYGDTEHEFSTGRALKIHQDRQFPNEGIVLGAFRRPRLSMPAKPKSSSTELEELIEFGQSIKPLLVKNEYQPHKPWLIAQYEAQKRADAQRWARQGRAIPGWGLNGNPLPGYGINGKLLPGLDGKPVAPSRQPANEAYPANEATEVLLL